jgi:pyruvate ferredoxin oxidoreductase gamma subunit/2-oxoisovalerate ferredoxin oxidoreductase gamma subunit
MLEIRFHGRGGQGAVIASKVSAIAAFKAGYYPLAFPQFGVERRGAPVTAFLRIHDPEEKLFLRCNIYNPDIILVLDTTLLEMVDVTEGLKEEGKIIINSPKNPDDFEFSKKYKVFTVDATQIAIKNKLGSRAQPIVNTAILGALARVLNIFGMEELTSAIEEEVPVKIEENKKAAEEAFNSVKGI